MSNLKPQYTLFNNLEQMLAPDTLSEILHKPITGVCYQPITGHSGLAGGQLNCVDTDAGQLVLKHMSIKSDWIMFASNDHLCRSVKLWQYGLLDRLRPHLEHKIIACSHDGDAWAILMEDLSGNIFTRDEPMPPELVPVFIDALAKLHAIFWNDPSLEDPRLGLCDPARMLDQSSLPMAQRYRNPSMGVIPDWVLEGWEVMDDLLDADVFAHMHSLIGNPQPLFDALSRYPRTLLHGDYRAENLAYSDHPVAIDWQEATHSLMTIDLAWFTKHRYVRDVMGHEGAINYYRHRLQTDLNEVFEDTEWQVMIDLGYLVDALRSTCFDAYWYKHTDASEDKCFLERAVIERNQQVHAALRWL